MTLLSCGGNKHTPVDNPSFIDRTPQFEPITKTSDEKLSSNSLAEKLAAVEVGQPELSGELTDYKGSKVSIDQFDGKPKVIGFWASWCAPCLKEKPYFKTLSIKFPDIEFLSLSVDESRATITLVYIKK